MALVVRMVSGSSTMVYAGDGKFRYQEDLLNMVHVLEDLGFAPERRTADGEQQVGLRHCPFLELAENRTNVVCPVHLGLMRGALETWKAPVTVDRLEAFVEPDLCIAHLKSRDKPK